MKASIVYLLLTLASVVAWAQKSDTLYICYQNHPGTEFSIKDKHSMDPNSSMEYPYHGGMSYNFNLLSSDSTFNDWVSFFYYSYVPEGTDVVPGYIQVDSAYLEKQEWYTTEQLLGMSKTELIRTFDKHPSELVIMLLDENYMDTEPYILTRVYLYYPAEE
ncbi:hypothetical protein AB9P05_23830 [Roseivirga sp. BDSF3-8]|uniref:hypothetical protein n=1 Tax=Roseivirga sp. BDSF3-8 TaxID=3241598 RepID=UPI003532531B